MENGHHSLAHSSGVPGETRPAHPPSARPVLAWATSLFAPGPPLTCLSFSRLGHARFPLSSEVRDNTQHPLDQHDLAAVMHLVLLHR